MARRVVGLHPPGQRRIYVPSVRRARRACRSNRGGFRLKARQAIREVRRGFPEFSTSSLVAMPVDHSHTASLTRFLRRTLSRRSAQIQKANAPMATKRPRPDIARATSDHDHTPTYSPPAVATNTAVERREPSSSPAPLSASPYRGSERGRAADDSQGIATGVGCHSHRLFVGHHCGRSLGRPPSFGAKARPDARWPRRHRDDREHLRPLRHNRPRDRAESARGLRTAVTIVPTGNPRFAGSMEAAGIEPASAVAPERASTSVACD